ncbi:MAG: hypothetical protein IPM24_17570 [Bryobacterales bacterium]|nr:hypothetical protein [Bryobacterales bacterium]
MAAASWLPAIALLVPCLWSQNPGTLAPSYSEESIVNAADHRAGHLAPNTLATIYGSHLSWEQRAVGVADLRGGALPDRLAGVTVLVANIPAPVLFVSPGQVNFLIPPSLRPGQVTVRVQRDGTAGPAVRIPLAETAPAAFQLDATTVIATHPDGSLIDGTHPAEPGGAAVLYVTGLGRTDPDQVPGALALYPARIVAERSVRILFDGEPLADDSVFYAGVTPGFAGLYQINFWLPDALPEDPLLQVRVSESASVGTVRFPTRPVSATSP